MKFCSNTSEIDSYQIQKLEDFNLKESASSAYYVRMSFTSHNIIL